MKRRALLTCAVILAALSLPMKIVGEELPEKIVDVYEGASMIKMPYKTGGTAGVRWRLFHGTNLYKFTEWDLYLQSTPENSTVTNFWIEEGNANGSLYLPGDAGTSLASVVESVSLTYFSEGTYISEIGPNAFEGFSKLKYVTFPQGKGPVTIGDEAFKDCKNLFAVNGLQYVVNVGDYGFYGTGLRKNIPQSTWGYVDYQFANSSSISIGSAFSRSFSGRIGVGAFYGCTNFTTVIIGSPFTTIGNVAFAECSALNLLTIGDNVNSIGTDAFRGCTNLSNIKFGKSLPGGVDLTLSFPSAMNLNTIEISDNNPYYTDEGGCLVDITTQTLRLGTCNTKNIPQGVVTIGKKAFYGRTGLESVALPATVTTISSNAFNGCTALREFTCNATTPPTFGANAFTGIPDDAILYVPTPAAVTAYADSEWYIYFKDIRVGGTDTNGIFWTITQESDGNYTLTISGNGAMTDYNDTGKAPWSRGNIGTDVFNKITKVVIDEGVTHIGNYALSQLGSANSNDVKVEFPSTLTSIGSYAFSFSYGLKNLEIPSSVNNIGTAIHYYCKNLSAITTSKDNTTYYTKDNCLIEYSSNTLVIGCYTSTIPDGVEIIAPYAFSGQNQLDEIALPSSLTSVGARAFYSCSRLTSISFGEAVNYIGDYAFNNCSSLSSVTCLAYEAPTLFNNTFSSKPTLYVYYTPNYSSHSSKFKSIEAIPITITDGTVENYEDIFEEDILLSRVEYNRTLLADSKWNALYVPFEIPVADIIDKYDVAYINDVRLYDSNGNNETDENDQMATEVIKVTSGTLHANHPYIIRVKKSLSTDDAVAARNMSLALSTKLCQAEENTYDCSSLYTRYEFAGTYNKISKEQIMEQCGGNAGLYAIATDGSWHIIKDGSSLKPFRVYLSITNRDGSPYRPNETAAAAIRIRVAGEEDEETTGIDNSQFTIDNSQFVYDMQGRRVEKPTKGIYIVGGKKAVMK